MNLPNIAIHFLQSKSNPAEKWKVESNQYEYTGDLKYGDNQGNFYNNFINYDEKQVKSKIFHLWSNLVVLILCTDYQAIMSSSPYPNTSLHQPVPFCTIFLQRFLFLRFVHSRVYCNAAALPMYR